MNRNHKILLAIVAVLLVANIARYIYSHWGLITVNADNRPVAEVIRSIEKQSGATIRTDLPSDTQVTMHVRHVALREAMETLAAVTEARWRLTYIFGADKGAVEGLLATVPSGQRPEGWKMAYYALPGIEVSDSQPADPRKDPWAVKAPAQMNLQEFLEQGAQSVSAAFLSPEGWNPPIGKAPSAGPVTKVAPKLAKLAGGAEAEVFLLIKGQRPPQDDPAPGVATTGERGGGSNWLRMSAGGGGGGGGGPLGAFANAAAIEARARAEIEKLPASERPAAQAALEERKQFFMSLRDLPPEERREKAEQYFNRPEVQQQMDAARNAQDARFSPAQRVARAQKYVQRRAQMRESGGAAK